MNDDQRREAIDAALRMLRARRDLWAEAEEVSTQSLEKQRQMSAALPASFGDSPKRWD